MGGAPNFVEFLQRNVVPRRRLMGTRFRVISTLGRGSFGEVLLVEDKHSNGSLAVVKRSKKSEESTSNTNAAAVVEKQKERQKQQKQQQEPIQAAVTEAMIMANFNDDGIVRLMDFWYDEDESSFCFLMEYCAGGDLEVYLQQRYPLSEDVLLLFFLQCLLALAHIHNKKILHRDLKLSNILVSPYNNNNDNNNNTNKNNGGKVPTLKMADFGLSAFCGEGNTLNTGVYVGTPLYMSPETITKGVCNYSSDVWSLGVVFYRLMTNHQPFVGGDFAALRSAINTSTPPHPSLNSKPRYSRALGDLVLLMLAKESSMRPSPRRLIAAPIFAISLRQSLWRSRSLRGALCLFVCRLNYELHIFEEPRVTAPIVATLNFADHVLVTCEVHTRCRSRSPQENTTISTNTTSTERTTEKTTPIINTNVWCRVVGPHAVGYCPKYDESGHRLLRHVGDSTPCGIISSAVNTSRSQTREASPEPMCPSTSPSLLIKPAFSTTAEGVKRSEIPLTSFSPPREKTRSSSAGKLLSALFGHCG